MKFTSVFYRRTLSVVAKHNTNMAAETGNNYISGTTTDSVEIPTPNSVFSMMTRSIQDESNDLRERSTTRNCKVAPKTSPFPVVGRCSNRPRSVFFRAGRGRKLHICRQNCHPICYSSRDISISGFGGHIAISGCHSMLQSLVDTFCELALVENPRFSVGIVMIAVILSEI